VRTRALFLILPLLSAGAVHAGQLPQGGTVVGGNSNATISTSGGTVTVDQKAANVIINWTTFNLGAGNSVIFDQASSAWMVLNRVTGGQGPSWINGTITAPGTVIIVNADGIVFGSNAQISTGSFLATTSDIRNRDFERGYLNFSIPGRPDASITNRGSITANNGGFAALVAPQVRNSGTITANLGTVFLGAGNVFTMNLDFYGDRLITLGVSEEVARFTTDESSGQTLKFLVSNTGTLKANGGRVELTAAAARQVVDSVVNTTGVIEANSVGFRNGQIVLSAATVKVSGTLSAAGKGRGTTGGDITISGEKIKLRNANINASGRDGGGRVMIGTNGGADRGRSRDSKNGDQQLASTVSIDSRSIINVSATRKGDGGDVIIASADKTSFAGTVLALGGRRLGDGGFVAISSQGKLSFTGKSNTSAPHGDTGTLRLAAPGFAIVSEEGPNYESWLTGAALDRLLATNNVTIVADARRKGDSEQGSQGDIMVEAPLVKWTSANTLTLRASYNIALNGAIAAANGGLTLDAGHRIKAPDAVSVGTFTLLHGVWRQDSAELPAFSATDFRIEGGSFLRAAGGDGTTANPYLITDIYGLQGIGTLHGAKVFDLANNIDATGTAAWNNGRGFVPIGNAQSPFGGTFDGEGYTISNLTIASTQPGFVNVGLFGVIGKNATVSNLNIDDAIVAATSSLFSLKSVGVLAGWNLGTIENVNVTGTVGLDGNGVVGGLVGRNSGVIENANADVVVVASGNRVAMGGLVGFNGRHGSIETSQALGDVTFDERFAFASVAAGGLVGVNAGTITASQLAFNNPCGAGMTCASGNVSTAMHAEQENARSRTDLGGLVGLNLSGALSNVFASGAVTTSMSGANAGGLVGVLGAGSITGAFATGAVTANGTSSNAGGLVGRNAGAITQTFATGPVTGGDNSAVGGLAAFNSGAILQSFALGATTGGTNSHVAGLVAQNSGSIDQTYAVGRVTAGAGSVTGGLASTATTAPTDSYWDTQATGQTQSAGGTPMTTAQLTSGLPPGFNAAVWVAPSKNYPCFSGQCSAGNPSPGPSPAPPPTPIPGPSSTPSDTPSTTPSNPPPDTQSNLASNIISNILNGPPQTGDLFQVQAGNPSGSGPSGPTGSGNAGNPPGSGGPSTTGGTGTKPGDRPPLDFVPGPGPGPLPSGMPPVTETRFVSNEVVLQLGSNIPPEQIAEIEKEFGLEVISQQTFGVLGRTVYRFRITGGANVRQVIVAFEVLGATVSAQPSYNFELTQDATMAGSSQQGAASQQGDSSQYVVAKLGLIEAHALATGKGVKIAVIDSEIDAQHPDLAGAVSGAFDALPSSDQRPHPHGTGMAGAIGSHQRLIGIAPGAQILGIRAFGASDGGAQGTSVNIVKGLEWAVEQGAQIINMSFAGPRDPILEQALKSLADRGIILVGAAGNAGPKSPPLFPGADPNVIGVSATDLDDKTFKGANRGKQVAIAAPGVDVVVPAPEGGYQLTTGTSVAAAEVSGVVALMLEHNPKLTPSDVRNILTVTAKKLPQGRTEVGAGLIDPVQALARSGGKQAGLQQRIDASSLATGLSRR